MAADGQDDEAFQASTGSTAFVWTTDMKMMYCLCY